MASASALAREDLPDGWSVKDIFALSSIDEVQKVTIVYEDNKSAELTPDDTKDLLGLHWNFYMDRFVQPYYAHEMKSYFNVYTDDKKFTIGMWDSYILYGSFGEGNGVWYRPYVGNARNALYSKSQELYDKYYLTAEASDETPVTPSEDYLNLPEHEWAISEVQSAAENNLLPYELARNYESNITREEFCNLAVQMLAEKLNPGINSLFISGVDILKELRIEKLGTDEYSLVEFKDYDYAPYSVNSLALLGVISGRDDGSFDPNGSISREEAAKILCNIANLFIETPSFGISFADNKEISVWAKNYVSWVSQNVIMNGIGDNKFDPKGTYTIEQAIATVNRLYAAIK